MGLHRQRACGEEISFSAIARKAGVDRSLLYRHRDLHASGPSNNANRIFHRERERRPWPRWLPPAGQRQSDTRCHHGR
jgi:hypothetical protein